MAIWQIVLDCNFAIWQAWRMTLSEYLQAHGIKPSKFAESAGLAPSTITRILNGKREPSMSTLRVIRDATNGLVLPKDFFDAPADPQSETIQ